MAIYFHCIAVATIEIPNPLIDLLNVSANSKKIANFVMRFSSTENEIQNSFFFEVFMVIGMVKTITLNIN